MRGPRSLLACDSSEGGDGKGCSGGDSSGDEGGEGESSCSDGDKGDGDSN